MNFYFDIQNVQVSIRKARRDVQTNSTDSIRYLEGNEWPSDGALLLPRKRPERMPRKKLKMMLRKKP